MSFLRGRLGVAPAGLAGEGGLLARVDRAAVSRRSARGVFSRNLVAAAASTSADVEGGRRTSNPEISADPKSREARPEGADPEREATEAAALWACEARRCCTRAPKGVMRSLAAAKRAADRSSASSRDRRGGLGRHDAFSPPVSARLGADFFAPPANPPPACAARRDARIASMGLDRRGGPTPSPPTPIAARTGAREAGNNETRLRANRARRLGQVGTGIPRNSREPNSRAPRRRIGAAACADLDLLEFVWWCRRVTFCGAPRRTTGRGTERGPRTAVEPFPSIPLASSSFPSADDDARGEIRSARRKELIPDSFWERTAADETTPIFR
jgi:hypothetical protein